jgi:HSP20 family protein
MRIVPYVRSSASTLEPLRNEIDRLINFPFNRLSSYVDRDLSVPPINMWEDKDNIFVETDMPGMDPKNIKVSLKGDTLLISGKAEEAKEETNKEYFFCERYEGNFSREVELPSSVDASKVYAEHKNGVLKLTLPKKSGTGGSEIQINVK